MYWGLKVLIYILFFSLGYCYFDFCILLLNIEDLFWSFYLRNWVIIFCLIFVYGIFIMMFCKIIMCEKSEKGKLYICDL